jgi:hypothetical protein
MRYTVRRGDEELGSFDLAEIQSGFNEGRFRLSDMAIADGASEWLPVSMLLGSATTLPLDRPEFLYPRPAPASEGDADEAARFRERLARYERLSAIVWLVIAVIQILAVVTIVAGIWNIFASVSRFRFAKAIREDHPGVVRAYEESLWMLIVMGCVNFFLGGFIAAGWIAYDFHVRNKVLRNRRLLEPAS